MPYVNKPRPYKKEYQQQKERNEHERRMKRQDIDHKKPLSRGGSNSPKNLRLVSSKKNRKFKRRSDHKPA